jgi:hypothetical protein
MIEALAIIWAISAAICWEAHADSLPGPHQRFAPMFLGSIMPIYNTVVAWSYAMEILRRET